MFIGVMEISKLMVFVKQYEEKMLRDREDHINNQANTGNDSGQQKSGLSRPQFHNQKGYPLSSVCAPCP